MTFFELAGAVFLANVMTAAFLWGCLKGRKPPAEVPWLGYAAIILPLVFALSAVMTSGGLPPYLDALAAQ